MTAPTRDEIEQYFDLEGRIRTTLECARDAAVKFHPDPDSWDQKVLREGDLTNIEQIGDTLVAEFEYFSCGDTSREVVSVPIALAGENGHSPDKWGTWAAARREKVLQDRALAASRVAAERAKLQTEQELAQLRELMAKYPEQARK